ncbi:MAG: hypothetical protein KFF73_20665 [Cyclobacteriaceae bacterium]|nr:hypothetical protein [Cyclobacteriaceae bacterium]
MGVSDKPVITKGDAGTDGNKFGFEGGQAIKYNDEYHLFTTEMVGYPLWTKTILGYWKSKDGNAWERVSTVFESSGDFTGKDPRACLWSPMPTYDAQNGQWVLTYVAYNSKPNSPEGWYRNYNGKIWMAVSEAKGYGGLGGPYKNKEIILKSGPESDSWEGLMGTDSFYPFHSRDGWLAFYGSSPESVGLAAASELTGPWTRKTKINPIRVHIENPMVYRLTDGRYVALFDGCGENRKIGYMVSDDGICWSEEIFFELEHHIEPWWGLTRTPLGLIQESEDQFTVFFTAYNRDFYEIPNVWQINDDSVFEGYFASVGMFRLRLIR